jgi:hypothetical protein
MINIEIEPLKGITIQKVGNVLLGEKRKDVEKLLGKPDSISDQKRSFYDKFEVRIDFDIEHRIEGIEFIYGPFPQRTTLSIYGINPFTIGAEDLVKLLTEKNQGDVDYTEAEYSYAFPNISVGIWRSFTQADVEESIAKIKSSGKYEDNRSSIDDDLEKSKNFWTIGIGVMHYFS